MKFSLKTLALGFGILAVLYGALSGIEHKVAAMQAEASKNTRLGPRACGVGESETRRQRLKRARKLSSVEAEKLLRSIIIPKVEFEDVILEEALDFVNAEIQRLTPEGQVCPKIYLVEGYNERSLEDYNNGLWLHVGKSPDGIPSTAKGRLLREVRLANVSAERLLYEIAYAAWTSFWIYEGDVYFDDKPVVESLSEFYKSEVIDEVVFDGVRLDNLAAESHNIISQHEYRGHKSGIGVFTSKKVIEALRSGDLEMPVLNLSMQNITMAEALKWIATAGGESLKGYENGVLIYDPFSEMGELNPFDPIPSYGPEGQFNQLLHQDWDKPQQPTE